MKIRSQLMIVLLCHFHSDIFKGLFDFEVTRIIEARNSEILFQNVQNEI